MALLAPAPDLEQEPTRQGPPMLVCPECKKSFPAQWHSNFVRHLRKHSGDRPYICVTCSASFTTSGNLARHRRAVHRHTAEVESDAVVVKRQREGQHPARCSTRRVECELDSPDIPAIECDDCGAVFGSKSKLQRHLLLSCPFREDIGYRDDSTVDGRNRGDGDDEDATPPGKRSDDRVMAHVCPSCGEGFQRKRYLKRHETTCSVTP